MEGERASIHVESLIWSEAVQAKLLARGRPSVAECESILDGDPIFIAAEPGPNRVASHVIIGRSRLSHSIAIYVSETAEPGVWYVHTALRSRLAGRILRREGRLG